MLSLLPPAEGSVLLKVKIRRKSFVQLGPRRAKLGLLRFCDSDPILQFLRDRYDAIPLSLPDPAITPLAILIGSEKRIRYLGPLSELSSEAMTLNIQKVDLPDVTGIQSSTIKSSVAIKLLGPFLSQVLELLQVEIDATLQIALERSQGISVAISRAARQFVAPLAIARVFESSSHRIPIGLVSDHADAEPRRIYLVDSVLTSRAIRLTLFGDDSDRVAATLESEFAGKVAAENLLRTKSSLTISGRKPATFAFTCLALNIDEAGFIRDVAVPMNTSRLGLTGVQSIAGIPHARVGADNELLSLE